MNNPYTVIPGKHGNYRGNRAIILLRISLWLIPAIILCIAIPFAIWLGELWYLSVILMLAAFTAIGYFDMLLIHQQGRSLSSVKRKTIFNWALTFAAIQLIIAPGVTLILVIFISSMIRLIHPGFSFFP